MKKKKLTYIYYYTYIDDDVCSTCVRCLFLNVFFLKFLTVFMLCEGGFCNTFPKKECCCCCVHTVCVLRTMCDFHIFGLIFAGQCTVCLKG